VDFASFVGRHPDDSHVWLVTGDSGQGITNGAVAGLLIPALMEKGEHPWRALYDPARVSLGAAKDFVAENVTAVKGMAEHLAGPFLSSEDELKAGEGGLVKSGLRAIAAFRDEAGALHRLSASCTHVGCMVHFNSFERCWDCPCHGSQFAPDGEAINAPATADLERLD